MTDAEKRLAIAARERGVEACGVFMGLVVSLGIAEALPDDVDGTTIDAMAADKTEFVRYEVRDLMVALRDARSKAEQREAIESIVRWCSERLGID